jgi:hypothetical protein
MALNGRARHCWFCRASSDDVELLFVSSVGGLPPVICSGCVEGYAAVLGVFRVDAAAARDAVISHNSTVRKQPPRR